ncbi:MAG: hypothetical protein K1060chlam5_01165 [Candidatus Anoxychlamydiales bacterium]|nr:hypothetical protein [Candidatus Anoxychlamydiales bacterium]
MIKVGIDFDNTIVCYDNVFHATALEKKLIPTTIQKSKEKVRDYLRSIGKEKKWTQLQGYVYGARMDLAKPFNGIGEFFKKALKNNIEILIISHKTLFPFMGPKYDLHKAAKNWLKNQNFYNDDISAFFELTLKEKLNRISKENCDYFIDDLPELLTESSFASNVKKILFDPQNLHKNSSKYQKATSWQEILSIINER